MHFLRCFVGVNVNSSNLFFLLGVAIGPFPVNKPVLSKWKKLTHSHNLSHVQHEQVITVSFKWVMKFLKSGYEILNFFLAIWVAGCWLWRGRSSTLPCELQISKCAEPLGWRSSQSLHQNMSLFYVIYAQIMAIFGSHGWI